MSLDEAQTQTLLDVAATGAAFGRLRPLFSKSPLPLPFRLPSEMSWAQANPGDALDADEEEDHSRLSSDDLVDETEDTDSAAPVPSAPTLAGIGAG